MKTKRVNTGETPKLMTDLEVCALCLDDVPARELKWCGHWWVCNKCRRARGHKRKAAK